MASLTRAELITNRLTPLLNYLQEVEAFNHLGRQISSTVVRLPYDKWLATPAPLYRKNGSIFTPTSVDTDLGEVTVSDFVTGDEIRVDYKFQYFSTTELENFYELALSAFNNAPPATNFSFTTYPEDVAFYLTMYAYKLALQTLLLDLSGWRARIIWTDPVQMASTIQGLLSDTNNYLSSVINTVKGRRFLVPKGIVGGRWKVPAMVSETNWQSFTIIRN